MVVFGIVGIVILGGLAIGLIRTIDAKPELVRRVLGAAHGWPRTSPDNEPLPMLEGPEFEPGFLPVLTEFRMEEK